MDVSGSLRRAVVLAMLVLAGCAQGSSGEVSNLFERKWTWIDFISAGDIRRACAPGAADRVRFVLNADRSRQVRVYDLDTAAGTLRTRVLVPTVSLKQLPIDSSLADLFSPADFTVQVDEDTLAGITAAWRRDIDAPRGERPDHLLTEWHFWLVGACIDGRYRFDVWVSPDADYRALQFPARLLPNDISNIPVYRQGAGKRLGVNDYNPARQQGFSHYMLHLRDDAVVIGQTYGEDRSD